MIRKSIWNGGRVMTGYADRDNIINTIHAFNDLGIPIRYTFTNQALTEYHVYDTYCNMLMELADNGMNEVLVNSPILEEYLRDKYPNFKYISSTTKCLLDKDSINNELANPDYSLVVIDFRKNSDLKFLRSLKHKDKVELLINAYCSPQCPKRKEHYQELSECQLKWTFATPFCDHLSLSFYDSLQHSSVIKMPALYSTYVKMGFNNFKIEGRTLSEIDVLESYMYYLVKPEHRDVMRYNILKSLWKG